ncbi:Glycosyltransferase, GT2 family [Cognatiyoonia sediminum]|uniref:Glycosyltransferase, GT2 family n=1 Tax=Cognatiyoonia sediminum TaxID=1508389 RepID=A0A1M5QX90_9RHOB|nr:glycosyltransferase [Cognatiyoonia sediminum]SHH18531.1 Glycosyltransferase, GT2 family [Cognatiyoonia sediminum]
MTDIDDQIAAVIIGRNEGERLKVCLQSLHGQLAHIIYVDSGSNDGSQEAAVELGATLVELDPSLPFTAARARNAGLSETVGRNIELIQFVDGDCTVQSDWIETAAAFLASNPHAAVACGRRREKFPEKSVYNRLIDKEWNTPVGEVRSCGGDALIRKSALDDVGGFNPTLIAGEEPELCVRLRGAGWSVHRLDHEMTLHDAAIFEFGQWWKRSSRAGHAYAEGFDLHGSPPENHNRAPMKRAVVWGLLIPFLILALLFVFPLASLVIALLYPMQVARLAWQRRDLAEGFFLTLGKLPEAQGIAKYHLNRFFGKRSQIIEYKE